MRRRPAMTASVTVTAVFCSSLVFGVSAAAAPFQAAEAAVTTAASGGTWGDAREMPGQASLGSGFGQIFSVSCASAGNCSAGGVNSDGTLGLAAFVVSEVNGSWDKAEEVPGIAALNLGGDAQVSSVSCRPAGDCSAGGFYEDSLTGMHAFVVSEVNGTWGKAQEVPGTPATAGKDRQALVSSVSCASAGNCSAGGGYDNSAFTEQAIIVGEVNGKWGAAEKVSGLAALGPGASQVGSVSCASARDCSAGGFYTQGSGGQQAFVVSEVNGKWGKAQEVPGTAALNKDGQALVSSVSCASAGNCSAGGVYADGSGAVQVFVVGEAKGKWGKAEEVPGTAALNKDRFAENASVSCASAGGCSAGGYYTSGSGSIQAFVVSEAKGKWGKAEEVPGTAALNKGRAAQVTSVSCASAGDCSAGGYYTSGSGSIQGLVVSEVNGKWGKAEEVPGTAALNKGRDAQVTSVSCASAGNCSAGGYYYNEQHANLAFVVSEKT
jgi:hypothetical protein